MIGPSQATVVARLKIRRMRNCPWSHINTEPRGVFRPCRRNHGFLLHDFILVSKTGKGDSVITVVMVTSEMRSRSCPKLHILLKARINT